MRLPYGFLLSGKRNPVAVPMGGKGDLRLGIADGTENYVPLGQPDVLEHPQTGEVIYYDTATKDVFCRAWCWKNGNRSKLMPETTNAVINVDAMPPLPLATAEQAAEEVAGLLRRFTGAKTVIHKLTAETPRFTL
jgi:DNA/RNA-binding domain of Phe-tRNA-synthetase-like protein